MADNGVNDGGGHARMLSGDVIWCGTCGAYADLRVSGLTEACTGKHTGPWRGGGKRGQLSSLRKNRHPKNRSQLPPAISESLMTLDLAATASSPDLADAASSTARYSAKDKATARANAIDPQAALTDEKRQWISNKRTEAIQRATRKRTQPGHPPPTATAIPPSSSTWAARIRASFANKKARRSDGEGGTTGPTTAASPLAPTGPTTVTTTTANADLTTHDTGLTTTTTTAGTDNEPRARCSRLTCYVFGCNGEHPNGTAATEGGSRVTHDTGSLGDNPMPAQGRSSSSQGTKVTDRIEAALCSGTEEEVTMYPTRPGGIQAGKRPASPDEAERGPSRRTRGRSSADAGTAATVPEVTMATGTVTAGATTCPAGTNYHGRTKCFRLTCFNADCNGDHASQRDRSPPSTPNINVDGRGYGGA